MAKEKSWKERYRDAEPIAVCALSNWGGVEILDFEYGIEDHVIARWYGESLHRVKLNYGARKTTFRIGRRILDLSYFMKVR